VRIFKERVSGNWIDLTVAEWHQINVKETSLQLVARLSARIFLGPQACRNPAWIGIMINYTVEAFVTAERLRMWPRWLIWLVHWFLPSCKKLRSQVQEARGIISQVLHQREQNQKSTFLETEASDEVNTFQWLEDCAKGSYYDPALLQMGLAVVATHTSADLLSQVIFDLCEHPELLQPLREEIVMVITQHGWSKNAVYNLKLLDSVLKESQRLKPMQIGSYICFIP
jgi:cytochrome P450